MVHAERGRVSIRAAKPADVRAIAELTKPFAQRGILVK